MCATTSKGNCSVCMGVKATSVWAGTRKGMAMGRGQMWAQGVGQMSKCKSARRTIYNASTRPGYPRVTGCSATPRSTRHLHRGTPPTPPESQEPTTTGCHAKRWTAVSGGARAPPAVWTAYRVKLGMAEMSARQSRGSAGFIRNHISNVPPQR